MLIAGIGGLSWLFLRKYLGRHGKYQRVFAKRKASSSTTSLQHNANAKAQPTRFTGVSSLGAPPEVLKWQVELHDLGRELKAELDSKMIAVRAMTQHYDRAAVELRDLIATAKELNTSANSPATMVQKLTDDGWDSEKIAEVLSLQPDEVIVLQKLAEAPVRNLPQVAN